MSAMEDMAANVLKKALGPEVAALLTAENMTSLVERGGKFFQDLEQTLMRIETNTQELKALYQGANASMGERLFLGAGIITEQEGEGQVHGDGNDSGDGHASGDGSGDGSGPIVIIGQPGTFIPGGPIGGPGADNG